MSLYIAGPLALPQARNARAEMYSKPARHFTGGIAWQRADWRNGQVIGSNCGQLLPGCVSFTQTARKFHALGCRGKLKAGGSLGF